MTTYSNSSITGSASMAVAAVTTAATATNNAIAASISAQTSICAAGFVTQATSFTYSHPTALTMSGDNPRIVTDKGVIDLDHLLDIVKRAEAILCVVKADMERLERYPALQEAYDHYRVVDALCRDDDDG